MTSTSTESDPSLPGQSGQRRLIGARTRVYLCVLLGLGLLIYQLAAFLVVPRYADMYWGFVNGNAGQPQRSST